MCWTGAAPRSEQIRFRMSVRATVVAEDPHLDEFVGGEAAVDFAGNCRCQAAAADQHCGFKGMGAGFERPAFDRRELQRHVNLLQTGILG
jgi:hypothetical protein